MHLASGIAVGGHNAASGHARQSPVRVARAALHLTSSALVPPPVAARPFATRTVAARPAAARLVVVAVGSAPPSAHGRRPQRQRPSSQLSKRPRRAHVATAVVPLEPPSWFDPTPEFARANVADPPPASRDLGGIRVRGRELIVPASPAPVARP